MASKTRGTAATKGGTAAKGGGASQTVDPGAAPARRIGVDTVRLFSYMNGYGGRARPRAPARRLSRTRAVAGRRSGRLGWGLGWGCGWG